MSGNLPLVRTFTAQEYEQLRRGFVPQRMEDKWRIVLEAETLSFHRHWTGTCAYQVRLCPADGGYAVSKAEVNRYEDRPRDDDYDTALLSYLIDRLLLGREAPLPVRRAEAGG